MGETKLNAPKIQWKSIDWFLLPQRGQGAKVLRALTVDIIKLNLTNYRDAFWIIILSVLKSRHNSAYSIMAKPLNGTKMIRQR